MLRADCGYYTAFARRDVQERGLSEILDFKVQTGSGQLCDESRKTGSGK